MADEVDHVLASLPAENADIGVKSDPDAETPDENDADTSDVKRIYRKTASSFVKSHGEVKDIIHQYELDTEIKFSGINCTFYLSSFESPHFDKK